jgi:hypothetical protein
VDPLMVNSLPAAWIVGTGMAMIRAAIINHRVFRLIFVLMKILHLIFYL